MFCCLCLTDSDDCKDLYDKQGQPNDTYLVAALFFDAQLSGMDQSAKCSQLLCAACWRHISDFHAFHKSILEAQEQLQHQPLQQFENVVKTEVDISFDYNSAADEFDDIKEPIDINAGDTALSHLTLDASEDTDAAVLDDIKAELTSEDEHLKDCRSTTAATSRGRKKRKTQRDKKKQAEPEEPSAETTDREKEKDKRKKSEQTQKYDKFIALHWKGALNCEVCGTQWATFSELCAHFREKHDNAAAYVLCCQKKFFHRNHFVDHLNVHLNPEYFKCDECGKCFANRRSQMNHVKSGHGILERQFECEICNKRFTKKSILRGHMDIHATGSKDYVCEHCNKGFVLKTRYEVHVRNVHADRTVCELCGKWIRDRYALRQHLLEHEGVEKRKWPCDQCDAKLHSKYSLGRHKRVAHHDGSTCYVCSECGKVSMTEEALLSHKKHVHQKERKYKCTICDKAFKVAIVLREHMTTHTGEDLYQCPHCPKTFKVSANMHHHRKRAHPIEWAANRRRRNIPVAASNTNKIANEIVL